MSSILEKSEKYVFELFKEKLPNTFLYHNYLHTQRVVESAIEIMDHEKIDIKDKELVLIAAWFHDTGYIHTIKGHEEAGAEIVKDFLKEEKVDSAMIQNITELILATKLTKKPTNILEEIIKDADTSHLSKDYFSEVSTLLKEELKLHGIRSFSNTEWRKENIQLFTEKHTYYTEYAINNWDQAKNKQLIDILKKQKKKRKKKDKEILKAKLKAQYKEESPERGIQTMYRVALRNHIKLSDIADTKANILLSVNAIIISLALANLIPKLDSPTNKHLMIPSLVLVLFSVASIILSIMSTQPKVTSGEFTEEEVRDRKVNLLFFGNFFKMPYNQYQKAINQLITNKNDIYEMLTKDLYFLGVVLNKKYKLLKVTYVVFTIGIILSVVSFIYAFSTTEFREIENIIP
ncbi:hypothetical protein GCM10022393_01830 [Aquimarina addita]|uniref:HD domain-containing protein n=1 Tax=Aquimarina addita TaxID=870485 RepID=A0ABP7X822_9FLAO